MDEPPNKDFQILEGLESPLFIYLKAVGAFNLLLSSLTIILIIRVSPHAMKSYRPYLLIIMVCSEGADVVCCLMDLVFCFPLKAGYNINPYISTPTLSLMALAIWVNFFAFALLALLSAFYYQLRMLLRVSNHHHFLIRIWKMLVGGAFIGGFMWVWAVLFPLALDNTKIDTSTYLAQKFPLALPVFIKRPSFVTYNFTPGFWRLGVVTFLGLLSGFALGAVFIAYIIKILRDTKGRMSAISQKNHYSVLMQLGLQALMTSAFIFAGTGTIIIAMIVRFETKHNLLGFVIIALFPTRTLSTSVTTLIVHKPYRMAAMRALRISPQPSKTPATIDINSILF